jgi:hypothetical protein
MGISETTHFPEESIKKLFSGQKLQFEVITLKCNISNGMDENKKGSLSRIGQIIKCHVV